MPAANIADNPVPLLQRPERIACQYA